MTDALVTMFSFDFMQRAVIGGILISLCAALLGVSLVLKKYSMIGDGLSHVGFGAVAVASVMNLAPLAVAVPVVVASAFILLKIGSDSSVKGDSAVAVLSTTSLAAGVIAVSVKQGINTDFNSYMFGSILGMSKADVILSICASVPVLALYILFYNRIFAVTFDETFSKATGVNCSRYNALIAVLTAVTVVLGMRLMGALLISSLIIFPALTAMCVCRTFKRVVVCSAVISVVCFFAGIYLSVLASLPTGASIVAVNAVVFCVLKIFGTVKNRI